MFGFTNLQRDSFANDGTMLVEIYYIESYF